MNLLRSWIRLGQGKDGGKPDKKNAGSRAERVRILKHMDEALQPCFCEAAVKWTCCMCLHYVNSSVGNINQLRLTGQPN